MKTIKTTEIQVGDKIRVYFQDEDTGRERKLTGTVYSVKQEPQMSKDFPTVRFHDYKGAECWFFGERATLLKRKEL